MGRDFRSFLVVAAIFVAACNDPPLVPSEPVPPPVRDALYRQLGDGALYLVRTDGSNQRRVSPPGLGSVTPIAITDDGRTVAILTATGLAIAAVDDIAGQTQITATVPAALGLSAFSPDGRRLAVPCLVAAGPAVLLYDRSSQQWDTIVVGSPGFFEAPAFSPDGTELVGIGLTPLSIYLFRVQLEPRQQFILRLAASRILNAPIFGWTRWTDEGLLFLVRQGLASPAPDTLAVVSANPANPDAGIAVRYRFLLAPDSGAADPVFAPYSTYALSVDGRQVIVAAQPDSSAIRHALYAGAAGGRRLYRVLDDPAQFPTYPQLIR